MKPILYPIVCFVNEEKQIEDGIQISSVALIFVKCLSLIGDIFKFSNQLIFKLVFRC